MSTYHALYDRIAADHVSHWRRTGKNPFQDPKVLAQNESHTEYLIYKTEGSILDVGCGMGDMLMRFPERETQGVDISHEYLQIARERGLSVRYAEAEALPFREDSFDVVVATDILEHVFDLNAVVRELVRVSAGHIIVRVPNMEPVCWDCPPYGFVHVRIFDQGTLILLFGAIHGCVVEECHVLGTEIHLKARVA